MEDAAAAAVLPGVQRAQRAARDGRRTGENETREPELVQTRRAALQPTSLLTNDRRRRQTPRLPMKNGEEELRFLSIIAKAKAKAIRIVSASPPSPSPPPLPQREEKKRRAAHRGAVDSVEGDASNDDSDDPDRVVSCYTRHLKT